MKSLWRRVFLVGVCLSMLQAIAWCDPCPAPAPPARQVPILPVPPSWHPGSGPPPIMAQGDETPTPTPAPPLQPPPQNVIPPPVIQPPAPMMPPPPSGAGTAAPLNSQDLSKVTRGRPFRLNFEDVDIKIVAKIVSEMTGRTILLDQKAQGKITIISAGEVTPEQAWDLFKQALKAYDFSLVYGDGIYRVVSTASIKQHGKVYRGAPPSSSAFSVAIVILRIASPEQVANVIKPMVGPNGYVAAYQAGNALIISDESDTVRRLLKIVKLLDVQPKPFTAHVYQPINIKAKELYDGLKTLYPEQTTGVKAALFDSIQAVYVIAPRDLFAQLDRTVAQLDSIPQQLQDPRDYFVYSLENANADDLAKLLAKMISSEHLEGPEASANIVTQPNSPSTSPSAGPLTSATGQQTAGSSTGSLQGGNANNSINAAKGQSQQNKTGFVSNQVSADLRTNSLIFYVTPAQYLIIKRLIARLDAPGRQVFVSAVVGEMDTSHIRNFGVNWQEANPGSPVIGQNAGLDAAGLLQLLASGGFVVGAISSQVTSVTGGTSGTSDTFPNSYAVFSFLFSDTDFNTLASPRVLTEDNQAADISVSTIVPFATGEGFNINGQPIINFDYREVGLNLQVTPHISQAHHVRLELSEGLQEIQSFQTEGSGSTQFQVPIVSKRQVDTTVTVGDGQTIVIGGLVQRNTTETIQRAPLLSDIPLIGELFKQRSKNDSKTTLMIFLTPHIVDTPEKLGELMEEYRKAFAARDRLKQQLEEEKRRYGKKPPHPYDTPQSPSWEQTGPFPPGNIPSAHAAGDGVPPLGGTPPLPATPRPPDQYGPQSSNNPSSGGIDPPTDPAHTATYRSGPQSSNWGDSSDRDGMTGPARGSHPCSRRHDVVAMRDVLEQLPIDFLQHHRLLPLGENEGRVRIGMCSRDSLAGLEDVRLLLERDVEPVFMSSEEVDEGLRSLMVSKLDSAQAGDDEAVVIADEATDLMRAGSDAPVVQLVNTILLKAMGMNASDVHIEPYEEVGLVRFRVDGVLQEGLQIPKGRLAAVIARIKVMSRLNLAESRLPQDGRIKVRAGDHLIDLRVSTLPTLFGERTVMRLLRSGQLLSLPEIGLWQDDFQKLKALSDYSYGMILATGPTGSGKSTTLYGMMLMIQSGERNMITIEDPVEYQVARIGQIQVNARIGLTFAAGLRSILRQDPDVIMVGEIRDSETAEIAVHAALTGHLMLSTLHTNDAPTAVSRLMDMGVEGYLLSSSLLGVMAQRLVRKLCVACRRAARPTPEELYSLGIQEVAPNAMINHPVGCAQCNGTGYKGRSGVFEIMVLNDELRRLIVRSGDAASLRQAARASGMRTLLEDGARKVLNGQTSIHEVLRATRA